MYTHTWSYVPYIIFYLRFEIDSNLYDKYIYIIQSILQERKACHKIGIARCLQHWPGFLPKSNQSESLINV